MHSAGRLPVLQSAIQSKWIDLYKLWRLVHECHAAQPETAIPWGHIASSLLNCPVGRQDAASEVLALYRYRDTPYQNVIAMFGYGSGGRGGAKGGGVPHQGFFPISQVE